MPIKKGNRVKVHYSGTLEDGTLFDSSEERGEPLEFEVGSGQLIKGFDEAVIGMEKDEKKEITIKPSEGYGEINLQMIQKIPREQLPHDQEIMEGMMLTITLPNGQQIPAVIKEVNDKEVTIDINHPLAGKVLNFKIKIMDYQ